MAGDWIKIREDLHADADVLRIARSMDTRPEHVVGYLVKFWSWASQNMSRENRTNVPAASVTGLEKSDIEQVLGLPGFLDPLEEVGWLKTKDGVISIPNFDRHLSESAKQRALEARRKAASRAAKSTDKCPKKNGQKSQKKQDQRREEGIPTVSPPLTPPVTPEGSGERRGNTKPMARGDALTREENARQTQQRELRKIENRLRSQGLTDEDEIRRRAVYEYNETIAAK